MAKRKSLRKIFGDGLPTGRAIGIDQIKIYVKNKAAFGNLEKKFVPTSNTRVSIGQGVFKYDGFSWDKGNIFCGFCSSLGSGMIQFSGSDAAENYKGFETTYLKTVAPELLSAFSLGTTVSFVVSLNDSWNEADVSAKFEKIIQQQERKQPKLAHTKDGLQIGSKSTDNFIVLVPMSSSDGIVTKIQFVAKISRDSSFFELSFANQDSKFEDILAFLLIQFLSKTTVSGFLLDVKTALIENHKIGPIQEKKATAVLSKDGKTVQRSLSAVRNKLISSATEKEAKQLFLKWLTEIETLFKNDESFKKVAANLIQSTVQGPMADVGVPETAPQVEETPSTSGSRRRNPTSQTEE